jgi:hypothetical protein
MEQRTSVPIEQHGNAQEEHQGFPCYDLWKELMKQHQVPGGTAVGYPEELRHRFYNYLLRGLGKQGHN